MNRNDKIFTAALGLALVAIILCAYAPNTMPQASIASRVWSVANSTFFVAIISTSAAGFAGTWGAQILAERSARRKLILDELKGVKTALGLAFNVAITYLGMKQQHTLQLHQNYTNQCAAREEHLHKVQQHQAHSHFVYEPDLEIIIPPLSPIDELKQVLVGQISSLRAHLLITPLMQSADGIAALLKARNNWIERWMSSGSRKADTERQFADQYFGLRADDGRLDRAYPSFISGLFRANNDCIGFSMVLIEALLQHGQDLCKKFGEGAPEIRGPDFSPARKAGLIPDLEMYTNWANTSRSNAPKTEAV